MEIIYTIPGLGTNKDLFKNISIPQHSLKILSWPLPQPCWKLSDYAKAFIDQIDISSPVNLMGVSFGGMLCCEIADLIAVNKVVIISSSKNKNEIPKRIRILKFLPFQKLISEKQYRQLILKFRRLIGFEKADLPEFIKMAQSMPPNYFKYCVNMIICWERKANAQTIYHIHGNADNLLPHNRLKTVELIEQGNHAMVIYKAAEVNVILKKVFNGL